MANVVEKFLEDNIKPYLGHEMTFPAHIQEAYLTSSGWLDKAFISDLLGITVSNNTFRKSVKQVFGTVDFAKQPVVETLSREEFFGTVYRFGGARHCREWVLIAFNKTGKVAKRETILNWIVSNINN
ncbi:hypothetical protein [Vibrio phage JSF12]|uniref:Uncharacterized protein n=1 Tax=Vibrio phage JSF12 TaxID=1983595 RepID=A0A2D0YMA0_9CAUD|nr:hypothetical protein HOS35_gp061 [Vibrio phage JSF12]ASV43579.1 hypothetical protein [Vibrio phage JSF12]